MLKPKNSSAPKPSAPKKSLFASFSKKPIKVDMPQGAVVKTPKKNKQAMMYALAALIGILVLGLLYLVLRPAPDIATAKLPEPAATAPISAPPAPPPATVVTDAPPPADSDDGAVVAADGLPIKLPTIDVDTKAIENAPIPDDPALIKEELDRLEDKTTTLGEQEKLLQEQTAIASEIEKKKQEQIELLEQQIALLEKSAKSK